MLLDFLVNGVDEGKVRGYEDFLEETKREEARHGRGLELEKSSEESGVDKWVDFFVLALDLGKVGLRALVFILFCEAEQQVRQGKFLRHRNQCSKL